MIKIKLDEDCVGGTVIKWSQYNDDDIFNYNDNIPVSENTHWDGGTWVKWALVFQGLVQLREL